VIFETNCIQLRLVTLERDYTTFSHSNNHVLCWEMSDKSYFTK